jgi:glycosyltransferase involved in cell wall biosynthesis
MTRKFSFHPMEKGVTIIIPTLNGGSIFPQCLAAIKGQENADPLQLIVVDSGSTDGTVERARKAGALVKRIERKTFHHARTRNEALALAAHENIVFTVQDAIPCSKTWLLNLVQALNHRGAAAAYTAQIPHDHATPYARFETESVAYARANTQVLGNIHSMEMFQKMPYDNAYRLIGLDNVCAIYRKEVLEKTPFPDVEFAEDLAWALKISLLGYRITYLPHIQVRHSHNRSPDYGFRRQVVNSYWVAQIMGRLREDISFLSLRDLAFLTRSVIALMSRRLEEKTKELGEVRLNNLFIDHLWKQHPLLSRICVGRCPPIFSKYPYRPTPEVKGIAQSLNADIAYQLKSIEEAYPPRDGKEWLETLEQVVANILGRIYGEVYAGCMLKGSVPQPLENFIKPFLSGV